MNDFDNRVSKNPEHSPPRAERLEVLRRDIFEALSNEVQDIKREIKKIDSKSTSLIVTDNSKLAEREKPIEREVENLKSSMLNFGTSKAIESVRESLNSFIASVDYKERMKSLSDKVDEKFKLIEGSIKSLSSNNEALQREVKELSNKIDNLNLDKKIDDLRRSMGEANANEIAALKKQIETLKGK